MEQFRVLAAALLAGGLIGAAAAPAAAESPTWLSSEPFPGYPHAETVAANVTEARSPATPAGWVADARAQQVLAREATAGRWTGTLQAVARGALARLEAWLAWLGWEPAPAPQPRAEATPEPEGRRIELYHNEQVRKFQRIYREVYPEVFRRGLRRSRRYLPMIRRVFGEARLPLTLAYLPAVESNFNPRAHSSKWAAGLWQFMPHTARRFDLQVSPWYDERLDPVLSTHAAARYLDYLHERFGSWELALAAYNAGEGRVRRAMSRARARGRDSGYWGLRLPLQTRRYVPAFLAVASMYEDPAAHGFAPAPPGPGGAGHPYETVRGNLYTTLEEVARRVGVPQGVLQELNPGWRQGAIPPVQNTEVMLRLPEGGKRKLLDSMARRALEPPEMITHRVSAGENLTLISERYGVSLTELVIANGIRNRNHLRRGQKLVIPFSDDAEAGGSREI